MSDSDKTGRNGKTEAKTDQALGKVKETVGRAVDDEHMEEEGRTQQSKGDLRQAGEKVKDAFKR
jgi:uncharacterized protein YjbJ (UPF0337 family)